LILDNYEEQDYLNVLDHTALMIYTSQFESFGFQLFEAWAKATPVIYPASLWGKMGFSGCGGIPLAANSLEDYQAALKAFLAQPITAKEMIGKQSRDIVCRDFSIARLSRELKIIYHQAFISKQEPPPIITPKN
jgi:glycosyltransferase involved in cell wall biosynthesis